MECVILAGGKGTRLAPLVPDLPKPLAPIGGRPFLDYLLDQLLSFGCITHLILSLGYKAESIVSYLQRKQLPFRVSTAIETTPLGTGGGLMHALKLATTPEPLLILNGDSFLDFSLQELLKRPPSTLCTKKVEDVARFGHLLFDSSGRILSFQEKGGRGPGWISAGVYLFDPAFLEELHSLGSSFSLEKEGFSLLLKKGLFSYPCSGAFCDIGTPESYQELCQRKTLFSSQEGPATLAPF